MVARINLREERWLQPIAQCLIRQLLVPHIYFHPRLPDSKLRPDIVAVDRAGNGDLHAVEIKNSLDAALRGGVEQIMHIPAHYRWVAYPAFGPASQAATLALISMKPFYPKKGAGRIGLIEVVLMADDNFGANVKVKAERFLWRDSENLVLKSMTQSKPDISFE
jgi:hypothetical protein